jgi:hypothetical protein
MLIESVFDIFALDNSIESPSLAMQFIKKQNDFSYRHYLSKAIYANEYCDFFNPSSDAAV